MESTLISIPPTIINNKQKQYNVFLSSPLAVELGRNNFTARLMASLSARMKTNSWSERPEETQVNPSGALLLVEISRDTVL